MGCAGIRQRLMPRLSPLVFLPGTAKIVAFLCCCRFVSALINLRAFPHFFDYDFKCEASVAVVLFGFFALPARSLRGGSIEFAAQTSHGHFVLIADVVKTPEKRTAA